jgi:tetratricopeptide (TPR) repeat protein
MPIAPRLLTALALAAAFGAPLKAQEIDAGAYLAARVAEAENDFQAATAWYGKAIISDGGNARLLEGAILAELGTGDFALAIEAANRLKALGGEQNQLSAVTLLADQAQREDYAAILADIEAGSPISDLVNGLVSAWAKVGEGKMSDALLAFDKITETKGLEAFGYFHKALALASVGDFEGADEILSGRAAGPIFVMRRGVFAHAEILSQLERNADALDLLDRSFGTDPDPLVDAMRVRLKAGEPIPFQTVRTARDGIAEVFYSVGTALNSDADPVYTLLHLRVASYLRPDHSDATLLTADVLQELKQYRLAAETYATFGPDDPNFISAEIGRAGSLRSEGNPDAAIEALKALARTHGNLLSVQFALGDMLRMEERFEEAKVAYTAAIDLLPEVTENDWIMFFYRGIAHEQSKDWPSAEADFRRSLELNPTQPQVLNYLGYGLVDRGRRRPRTGLHHRQPGLGAVQAWPLRRGTGTDGARLAAGAGRSNRD